MELSPYFFVIQEPEQLEDGERQLSCDASAQEYAGRRVRLLREADGYGEHGLLMVVKNNAGKTVFSLPF
jgi:hypothetical protein